MPPITPINPMDPNALQLWNALLGITNPNMVPETTVLQPPGTEPSVPVDSSQYAQLAQAVNADLPNPGQTFNGDAIPQEPIDQKGYPSMEAAVAAQNSGPTGEPPMTPELLAASMSPESTGQGMTEPSLEQPESQGFQSGGLLQNLAMALAAAAPGLIFGARSAGAGGKSYSDELKRQDDDRKLKMAQRQAETKALLSAMTAMQGQQLKRDLSNDSIKSREKVAGLNRDAVGARSDRSFEATQDYRNRSLSLKEQAATTSGPMAPMDDQAVATHNALVANVNAQIKEIHPDKAEQAKLLLPEAQPGAPRKALEQMGVQARTAQRLVSAQANLTVSQRTQSRQETDAIDKVFDKHSPDVPKVANAMVNLYKISLDPSSTGDQAAIRGFLKILGDSRFSNIDQLTAFGRSGYGDMAGIFNYVSGKTYTKLTDAQWDTVRAFIGYSINTLMNDVNASRIQALQQMPAKAPFLATSGLGYDYVSLLGDSEINRVKAQIPEEVWNPAKWNKPAINLKQELSKAAPIGTVAMIPHPKTGQLVKARKNLNGGWEGL